MTEYPMVFKSPSLKQELRFSFTSNANRDTCTRAQRDLFRGKDPYATLRSQTGASIKYTDNELDLDALTSSTYFDAQSNQFKDVCYLPHGMIEDNKGNFPEVQINGKKRFDFSTYHSANKCTELQLFALAGGSDSDVRSQIIDFNRQPYQQKWSSQIKLARSTTMLDRYLATNMNSQGDGFLDVCYVPRETLGDKIDGILLDYEPSDDRTPSNTRSFLGASVKVIHRGGYDSYLWANPLNRPGSKRSGIDSTNADELIKMFRKVSIMHSAEDPRFSQANPIDVASYLDEQMSVYGIQPGEYDKYKKVYIIFDLSDHSSVDHARQTREYIARNKLDGLAIHRNWARISTDPTNCDTLPMRKVECLATGRCID